MYSKLPGKVGPSPKLGFAPLAYRVHVGCARESQPEMLGITNADTQGKTKGESQ